MSELQLAEELNGDAVEIGVQECPRSKVNTRTPEQILMNDEMYQRGPFYDPVVEQALTGRWSDSLDSCFTDCCSLLMSCHAGFYIVYVIMSRLPPKYRQMAAVCSADPCEEAAAYLFIGTAIPCFHIIMLCSLHEAMAVRYKVRENSICFREILCSVCLLAQLKRHMDRAQGFAAYGVPEHYAEVYTIVALKKYR
jgi:hypothetical protein